ncbi:hypothetical protein [Bacteroides sp.]
MDNAMKLDAARAEIIRSLFEVDSLEALQKVKRSVARIVKSTQSVSTEDLTPYTMEELNVRIDEAEADIAAGKGKQSVQVFEEMEQKYPWLCRYK